MLLLLGPVSGIKEWLLLTKNGIEKLEAFRLIPIAEQMVHLEEAFRYINACLTASHENLNEIS